MAKNYQPQFQSSASPSANAESKIEALATGIFQDFIAHGRQASKTVESLREESFRLARMFFNSEPVAPQSKE